MIGVESAKHMKQTLHLEKLLGIRLLAGCGHRQKFETSSLRGWLWHRESEFCLALHLDRIKPMAGWLQRAGLLLASTAPISIHGLCVEKGGVWLTRYYANNDSCVAIAKNFELQLSVAYLLIDLR